MCVYYRDGRPRAWREERGERRATESLLYYFEYAFTSEEVLRAQRGGRREERREKLRASAMEPLGSATL